MAVNDRLIPDIDPSAKASNTYLSFFLAQNRFAIDIDKVDEIRSYESLKIASAPTGLSFLKGISQVKEEIVPIIDLRILLNTNLPVYDNKTIVIIVLVNKKRYGIIVDSVFDIVSLLDENIKIAPNHYQNMYVVKIAVLSEAIILILDIEKLLLDEKVGLL